MEAHSKDLKNQIKDYIEKYKDPNNHILADGSKIVNQKLSHFLIKWYNQAVDEFEKYGTTKNADTIKKLISN